MDHVRTTQSLGRQWPHSLWKSVRSWLSNAGGFNWRSRRFAGNLHEALEQTERLAILHALIGVNGTRHTTDLGRNSALVKQIVDQHFEAGASLRMMDVGCSGGVDARTTVQRLSKTYVIEDVLLADKYIKLLQSEDGKLIFDEDGEPLQKRLRHGFFSFHFATPARSIRIRTSPQRLLAHYLRGRVGSPASDSREVSLLDPSLRRDNSHLLSPYREMRFDAFKTTIEDTFEVVVCLHLLIPRYFKPEQIDQGRNNLLKLLHTNGILIMGDMENPEVWHHDAICNCMEISDV